MDEYERPETVGEVVTPMEGGEAAPVETEDEAVGEGGDAARHRQEGQSHEENRRYQAARRSGERAGYQRALRELQQGVRQEEPQEETGRREQEFLARDFQEFVRRFPEASLWDLDGDPDFRRFCGSRYGKEPISDLYQDYLELAGSARIRAQASSESKARRATGAGNSGPGVSLTAAQQRELDEWNRSFPSMKMTAKEFLAR